MQKHNESTTTNTHCHFSMIFNKTSLAALDQAVEGHLYLQHKVNIEILCYYNSKWNPATKGWGAATSKTEL